VCKYEHNGIAFFRRYWTATDRTHAASAAGAAAMTAAEASGVAGVQSLRAGEFDSRVDVVLYLLPPRARLAQVGVGQSAESRNLNKRWALKAP